MLMNMNFMLFDCRIKVNETYPVIGKGKAMVSVYCRNTSLSKIDFFVAD